MPPMTPSSWAKLPAKPSACSRGLIGTSFSPSDRRVRAHSCARRANKLRRRRVFHPGLPEGLQAGQPKDPLGCVNPHQHDLQRLLSQRSHRPAPPCFCRRGATIRNSSRTSRWISQSMSTCRPPRPVGAQRPRAGQRGSQGIILYRYTSTSSSPRSAQHVRHPGRLPS